MVDLGAAGFVFLAGLATAFATGLGALPFLLIDDFGDRWNVVLWGLASGIMLSASTFGLVFEGLAEGQFYTTLRVGSVPVPGGVATGLVAGVCLVVVADALLDEYEPHPKQYEAADVRKLVLILGVLTVHSFPEGVAVGVSFADLGLEGGVSAFGLTVPVLAVGMTAAISVHNVPEGVAISIPLRAMGVPWWRMVWWSVFSSLPQPVGAVVAFAFVRVARAFLPVGFGFAAGAMVFLVATEFVPEALETGADLPGGGRRELAAGLLVGVVTMAPLAVV